MTDLTKMHDEMAEEGLHRIRLRVAYDGTNYVGWQVQANGLAVQEVLQRAIEELVGEKVNVTGASRTDSGVHALGQVVVFDTHKSMPAWKYALALNNRLPKDIVVQESDEVSMDFHPRYTNVRKTYEYQILNRRTRLPALRLYSYFVPKKLNLEKMRKAGAYLVGEHDFRSFCSQKTEVLTTVRTIYSLDVMEKDDLITIRVTGNGFLYNMVRIIAGTLIKVGLEQKEPEDVRHALEEAKPVAAGPTAPAHGLTLVSIEYADDGTDL